MKRKEMFIIILHVCLCLLTACGDSKLAENDVERKSEVTETETIAETVDDTLNNVEQKAEDENVSEPETQTTEPVALDIATITDEQCRGEIDMLLASDPVSPAEIDVLAELGKCATFARVLDEKGGMFKDMDAYRKGALREQVYKELMWGENAITGSATVEDGEDRFDAAKIIPEAEAKALFRDVYGEEDFTSGEHLEQIEDGYVLLSFGDGDPWEIVEHMQFFEDDYYYLLTGPSFYEDNGGSVEYRGYADILFVKNPDSRYGVTMIYGRYRDEGVKVSKVDTSSELPEANGKSYGGGNLIDGSYETAWVEGVAGTGVGETITLHLDGNSPVYGIQLYNGYLVNGDLYEKNGKVTSVKVDFGGGNVIEKEVYGYGDQDETDSSYLASFNLNRIELEQSVMTDSITITITGAEAGYKYDDVCISEIKVY